MTFSPPERTPERGVWVAGLLDGMVVKLFSKDKCLGLIKVIRGLDLPTVKPHVNLYGVWPYGGTYSIDKDGTLPTKGQKLWVEPVTDEEMNEYNYDLEVIALEKEFREVIRRISDRKGSLSQRKRQLQDLKDLLESESFK